MLPYPYYVNDQTLALSTSGINPAIWARITGTDGAGAYSWEQVSPAELGYVTETINSRYGTTTDSQAYEISGNLQVPAGVIVQLLPGVRSYPSYVFRYQSAFIEAEIDTISLPYYGWHQVIPSNNGTYDPGPLNGTISLNFATELNDVPGISTGDRTILYQGYSSGYASARTYPQQTGNSTQLTVQNLTLTNVAGGTYTLIYYDIAGDPGQVSSPINGTDNASLIQSLLAGSGFIPAPSIYVTGTFPYFALQFNASLANYPMLGTNSSLLRNDQEWFFVFSPASSGGGNTTYNNSTVIYNGTAVYSNATFYNSSLTFHNTTTITSLAAYNTTFSGNITIGAATIYNTTITATNVTFYGGANYGSAVLTGGGTVNGTYNFTLIEGCQNNTLPATGQAFELNGVKNIRSSGNVTVIVYKFPSGEIVFDHCCNGSTSGNSSFPQPINRIYFETNATLLSNTSVALGMLLQTRDNFNLEIKRATGTPNLTLQNPLLSYYGDPTASVLPGAIVSYDLNNATFAILQPPAENGWAAVSNSSLNTGLMYRNVPSLNLSISVMDDNTGILALNNVWTKAIIPGLWAGVPGVTGEFLVFNSTSGNWSLFSPGADGQVLSADSGSPEGLKWIDLP